MGVEVSTKVIHGDAREKLKNLQANSIDLIITSPPYADARKKVYGGINPEKYVDWFLPTSQ